MKTKVKFLIVFGIILLAVFIFNSNTVQANTEEVYINISGIEIVRAGEVINAVEGVSYEKTTNTLTLNNYTGTFLHIRSHSIYNPDNDNFKINLVGTNTLVNDGNPVMGQISLSGTVNGYEAGPTYSVSFVGSGILNTEGIYYARNININGPTIHINNGMEAIKVEIQKGYVTAKSISTDTDEIKISSNMECTDSEGRVIYPVQRNNSEYVFCYSTTYSEDNIAKDVVIKEKAQSTADRIYCKVNVISETGFIYGSQSCGNYEFDKGGPVELPANLDLSKTYAEYLITKYLGESININSNLGKANYIGKYGEYYKYKINLKNAPLMAKEDDWQEIKILPEQKEITEYAGTFFLSDTYTVDNEIEYKSQTQTNTDTKLKFNMIGNFKGTVKAEEISKSDLIYSKVDTELKRNSQNILYTTISNIYIEEGSFEGVLKLTFDVGNEYNGKYYCVTHLKSTTYEFEKFEGTVENGKIEITVDSLSPFGIAISETKPTSGTNTDNSNNEADTNKDNTNNENKEDSNKLDETPKTGQLIGTVSILSAIAGLAFVGVVIAKRKEVR